MYAWQFAKLQHTAALRGWTRFVSMQNQYNLLRRQDERELLPMCADMGVGVVPYSPQGKGRLARPLGEQSHRSTVDDVVKSFDSPLDEPVSTPSSRSLRSAASAWHRSRWRGCSATP
jgi:1-deoxyxylulose-5-phosphate synthase